MKRFCALALLTGLLTSLLIAQVPITVASDAAKVLKDNNFLHDPLPGFAQPHTGPGLLPKDGTSFLELGNTPDFQEKHADSMRLVGTVMFLEGNCLFLVRGYKISSDEAMYDRVAGTATLKGHVHVDGDLFAVTNADSISIDFVHSTYVAKQGEVQVSPGLLQGTLRDKLYASGRESYGDQRELTTLDGSVTTCNYPVPHYDIEGRTVVLRPGRRVIFRHTKIRVLGYVVAQLPFLSIPLDNRQSKYIPYVGQDPIEGDFAKWLIGIPSKNPNYNLDTHEDFMSKIGIGLGVDYSYVNRLSAGTLSVYHVFGSGDDLILTSNHKQVFGWGTLTEQTDYEKDNHLVAPGTTSFTTRIAALIPQGERATDQITFSDASSSSSSYSNGTETLSVDDRRNYGKGLTSVATFSYFNTSSSYASGGSGSSSTNTQRLDVDTSLQKEFNPATLGIEYQRSIPIGSAGGYITTSDETPVITLTSDARRILGAALGSQIPFQTVLSWGDFQDPRDASHVSRGYFDFNFNKVDTSTTSRFHVDLNGDFRQGIYSDNTAQYVLGLGTNLRYDLGGATGLNLRYNYLRPFGYTPLAIDYAGYTNYLSGDLNFKPVHSLLVGAQSGFDFSRMQMSQIGWQQLGLRTEYQPTKWFLLRGLYTYDTYARQWQDVRLDLTYLPGATRVIIGADYDAETHIWTSVNVMVDSFKWGKLTSSTALAYDGYLNKFDSEQFNFVYDLHCAEAVFSLQENNYGFNSGTQFAFFIRLKALPFDVPFGSGTRGQPVGLSSGSNF